MLWPLWKTVGLFLTELNIALLYHVAIVLLSVSHQVSRALSTCEYLYQPISKKQFWKMNGKW